MREHLPGGRRIGNRLVIVQATRDRRAQNAEQYRRQVRDDQLEIAFFEQRQRRDAGQLTGRGQRFGGQEAADHQKDLDRDARVLTEPGKERWRQPAGDVGHRAVERQMVQYDELRSDRLEGVDKSQSRWCGAHEVSR